ncbi:AsmA family protein [Rhodospirillaceae bacterium KN72]|uniref:AsmA family protein n=1 Tax=Pacificispira spongiicola TaxID=2729598 RepID=A0A7Y0E3M4_9PROT|nr:AsmA family protein [Pacificispira spongiicola]NMM46609.1 AsmA family protein [Pacificispira spongiicola]
MGRFLKILGGVLAVLIVFVVGAVAYILSDLNAWKPEIEEKVKEETGRDLTIAGPIDFTLGADTSLKVSGVTLSNAEWGSRPNMVEIGSVEIGFKLFSLLGTPDISVIHVDKVRAIVEKAADGTSNTDFGPSEPSEPSSGGGGGITLPIIRDLRIADVQVVMKDAAAGTEQTFTLRELTMGSESTATPLALNMDASFDDLALIMTGTLGALDTMTNSGEVTPVDLVGNLAGVDVSIQGGIQDLAGQSGIDLTVSAIGQELADTAKLAGLSLPNLGGFSVAATLKGDGDDLAVNPLKVDLGTSDRIHVTIDGTIENAAAVEGVNLAIAVASDQIGNLSPVTQALAGQSVPPLGPLKVGLNVTGSMEDALSAEDIAVRLGTESSLLVGVTGDVEDLMRQSGIDLDLSVASPELGNLSDIAKQYSGQGIPKMGPMSLAASIKGGMTKGIELKDLALDFGKAETILVRANGEIDNLLTQEGVDLQISATSPEIGNLSPLVEAFTPMAVPKLGPLNLAMKVAGDAQGTMTLSDLALALGKAETLRVEANGSVADLVKLSGANLGFSVKSPDLSILSDLAGSDVPPIGPVDIAGSVKGDNGKPITLDPFTAKVGGSDVAGTVVFDGTGDVPSIVARLVSTRFDLADVTPPSKGGSAGGSGGAASGGGSGGAGDGRLIPNDPLPLDALKSINADIEYKAATFVATAPELTSLDLKVVLQGGKLTVSPFKAGIGEGTLDGTISLDGSQATPPLSVKLNGSQMGLNALLAGAGMRDKIVGPLDLTVNLDGAGTSPRAIASSLNGEFMMSMYDSRVLKKAFDDAMGETLSGLLASENGWVVIDCAVFDYPIKQGLAETKAGYTASGSITVATEGTINLGTEQLDLKAKPAGGGGLTSVPVLITGSFANPSIIPDPVAIGTGLLAGILTGGIAPALLAVVADLPEGHPCKKEVAESQEQLENAKESDSGSSQPSNPVEGVGKALEEGLGGAVKGLFGN